MSYTKSRIIDRSAKENLLHYCQGNPVIKQTVGVYIKSEHLFWKTPKRYPMPSSPPKLDYSHSNTHPRNFKHSLFL